MTEHQRNRKRRLAIERLDARILFAVSARAQEFVYQLNIARHDPHAYSLQQNLGVDLSDVDPSQPLAVNTALGNSAKFHADELAQNNYFAHQSAVTGDWPNKMARDEGYELPDHWPNNSNQVESLAAGTFYVNAADAIDALIIDEGVPNVGHRLHLLAIGDFYQGNTEIGVGYARNNRSTYTHYWAAHLARTGNGENFLTGVVYDDDNQNGRYDAGEGIGGVNVEVGSTTVTTNEAGGWSVEAAEGTYVVKVVDVAAGIDSVAVVDMQSQNIEVDFTAGNEHPDINFATYVNRSPTATDDSYTIRTGDSGQLAVLENDVDLDGELNTNTVMITHPPANGEVLVGLDGVITYTPDDGFEGVDSFRYKVEDNDDAESTEATVSLTVSEQGSAWSNPTNVYDVDGNGRVEPLDVLLIINRLNEGGPGPLPPIPNPPDVPPPYFDVNGDGRLAPIDALQIVNRINNILGNSECWDCLGDEATHSAILDSFLWPITTRFDTLH